MDLLSHMGATASRYDPCNLESAARRYISSDVYDSEPEWRERARESVAKDVAAARRYRDASAAGKLDIEIEQAQEFAAEAASLGRTYMVEWAAEKVAALQAKRALLD
jgi:hypothetical protein